MTGTALFDDLFASAPMAAVFCDRGHVQGMLDFEAALARAEAALGVIPKDAAPAIAAQCDAAKIDLGALGAAARDAGNTFIPLLAQLTALVARDDQAASGFVHWGATSQDAMDTGLVLQMRAGLDLIEADLGRLSDALAALARRHRDTAMAGRTWMQQALPVSFGLKAAGWLDAVERHRARIGPVRERAVVLQFGGAAGTLASLGAAGPAVTEALARDLGLAVPDMPWHGARDRVAEVGCALAAVIGSLGKMARDVALMTQSEVGEVAEPAAPGRGGSSAMPQKRNPVSAAAILAAAARAPALAATLLGAMPQEHERGLGGWQAEWAVVPELFRLAGGALTHAVVLASGLEVDAARMARNLDLSGGQVMAESVKMVLAAKIGQGAAHAAIARACRAAADRGTALREALLADGEVSRALSKAEIDAALSPDSYLGSAGAFIDRVLAARRNT